MDALAISSDSHDDEKRPVHLGARNVVQWGSITAMAYIWPYATRAKFALYLYVCISFIRLRHDMQH